MSKFVESADSRETSVELMEAILNAAGGDEARAEYIWGEACTEGELLTIIEVVTDNGRTETTDYCWGAMGSDWEASINAA